MIVYVARNLVNGKVYVGKTVRRLSERKFEHEKTAHLKANGFHKALMKYGLTNFVWSCVYVGTTDKEICTMEVLYIRELRAHGPLGYNQTDGGDGWAGAHHSEESRKRISAGHKGKKVLDSTREKLRRINTGKTMSEEARAKIRAKSKKAMESEEARQHLREVSTAAMTQAARDNISQKLKGIRRSEETRNRIGAAKKGNTYNIGHRHSEETKRKISEKAKAHWALKKAEKAAKEQGNP